MAAMGMALLLLLVPGAWCLLPCTMVVIVGLLCLVRSWCRARVRQGEEGRGEKVRQGEGEGRVRLLTKEEYREQGGRETRQALERLRR